VVTLDGSKSSDPDDGDGIAGFLWKQIAGPQVKLFNPPPDKPTFTAPDAGEKGATMTFQLTVTDNGGLPATDTCNVTVLPTGAKSPATEPPLIEAVLAELQNLLKDSSIPENILEKLKKAENLLEEAVGHFQKETTYTALKKADQAVKKLGNAAEKANGVAGLEDKLKEVVDALMKVCDAEVEIIRDQTYDIISGIPSSVAENNRFVRKAKKHWDKALDKQEKGKPASHIVKEFMKAVKQANKAR
jgi:hypothetical protein